MCLLATCDCGRVIDPVAVQQRNVRVLDTEYPVPDCMRLGAVRSRSAFCMMCWSSVCLGFTLGSAATLLAFDIAILPALGSMLGPCFGLSHGCICKPCIPTWPFCWVVIGLSAASVPVIPCFLAGCWPCCPYYDRTGRRAVFSHSQARRRDLVKGRDYMPLLPPGHLAQRGVYLRAG